MTEDEAEYYQAYQLSITPITKELLMNNFNLSEELTESVFEYLNLTEGVKVHEVLNLASKMNLVEELGNTSSRS